MNAVSTGSAKLYEFSELGFRLRQFRENKSISRETSIGTPGIEKEIKIKKKVNTDNVWNPLPN